tara:strand:- start:21259 stop:22437 length:1179 start_codon:yes stop_codon:yes gene_type:complete
MSQEGILNGVKLARVATLSFAVVSQLKKHLQHINEQGIDLTVVSSSDDGMDILNRSGIRHEKIQIPRDISLIEDIIALIKLYSFLRKENFDIVHSTTPKAGLLTAIAAYFAGVPHRFHTFTGQAWANLSGFKRWICILMDKLIIALNTEVYADSNSQVNFLHNNGVINELSEIIVLGNGSLAGVDLETFTSKDQSYRLKLRQQFSIPADSFVFLYLGRLNSEKGIWELLEAFRLLADKYQDIYLLLVGPLDFKEELEKRRAEHIISEMKNVIWHGYTDNPENFLSMSDILCCPSYREGFGTTVIEAGAMGLPSIGTDVVGLRDSIIDNKTGILVKRGDSEDLRENMEYLMNHNAYREELGSNALKNAVDNFSSSRVSRLIIEQYQKKLNEHA